MGAYVGVATVGVFVVWYLRTSFMGIDLSGDGHTPVTLWQLRHWETCPSWDGFQARPLLCLSIQCHVMHNPLRHSVEFDMLYWQLQRCHFAAC